MATALSTLIPRTRRYLRDFPEFDATTASLSSNGTTVTVAATASDRYFVNQFIELGFETMVVKNNAASATTITVLRAASGSSGLQSSYASGTTILINPRFLSSDIVDGINLGLDELWPYYYQEVVDETLTPDGSTVEFTIPNAPGLSVPISRISRVEALPAGFVEYQRIRGFRLVRGPTPKIVFEATLAAGTRVRLRGYAPLPHLSATTDTLSAFLPYNADNLACLYAAGHCLSTGEAFRVGYDGGPIDQREQANRPGVAMQAANFWFNRFERACDRAQMPPMRPHLRLDMGGA